MCGTVKHMLQYCKFQHCLVYLTVCFCVLYFAFSASTLHWATGRACGLNVVMLVVVWHADGSDLDLCAS